MDAILYVLRLLYPSGWRAAEDSNVFRNMGQGLLLDHIPRGLETSCTAPGVLFGGILDEPGLPTNAVGTPYWYYLANFRTKGAKFSYSFASTMLYDYG